MRWIDIANLLNRGSMDGEDIYNKSISEQCSMSRNIGLQEDLDSLVVADTPRVNDTCINPHPNFATIVQG